MTWTLQAMRDLNRADPLGGLGPRVEPTPAPAPAPFSRGDGFLVHPDGKLSTEIPPPSGPATHPVWPFPTAPAEPPAEPAGDVPEGAMWRCKHSGLYYKQVPGGFLVSEPRGRWQGCVVNWELGDFARRENFDPVAPAGDVPALKVGDKVRWFGNGMTNTVAAVRGNYFDVITPGGSMYAGYAASEEGKAWERVA